MRQSKIGALTRKEKAQFAASGLLWLVIGLPLVIVGLVGLLFLLF